MVKMRSRFVVSAALGMLVFSGVWFQLRAQEPGAVPAALPGGRFEFEVIESFDARYLGDTPGHAGKNGGLAGVQPNVALEDPVYRNNEKIGKVTGLIWDRGRGSLRVEFDPEPRTRIQVGDVVWVSLGGESR